MQSFNNKINLLITFFITFIIFWESLGVLRLVFLVLILTPIIINSRKSVSKRGFRNAIILIALLTFIGFISIVFPEIFLRSERYLNSFFNNYVRYLLLIIVSYFYWELIRNKSKLELFKIIDLCLKIHLVFFFIQLVVVYSTGYYLDYVHLITGEESRYLNVGSEMFKYRATGLFWEPSTYTSYICPLLIIRYLCNDKIDSICLLTIGSFILNFSTASLLISLLLLLCILVRGIKRNLGVAFLLVCVLTPLVIISSDLQKERFEGSSRSYDLRANLLSTVLERDLATLLVGTGLFSVESKLENATKDTSDLSLATFNDASVFVYFLIRVGIIGVIVFLYFIFKVNKNVLSLSLCLVAMVSKITPLSPAFTCFFILLILIQKESFYREPYKLNNDNNDV